MKSRAVRITLVLLVAFVLMALPVVGVTALGWSSAALLAELAAMSGLISALGLRWRGLIPLMIASAIASFAAVYAAGNPWASGALMLCVGAVYGLANILGLASWNLIFPVVIAGVIGAPPTITGVLPVDALATAGIVVGSIFIPGAIIMLAWKKPLHGEPITYTRTVNVLFTVNMAVLYAITGYLTAAFHAQVPGVWLAITIVAVMQPHMKAAAVKALERAGGTIIGFLIAIGVAASLLPAPLYYLAGFVFIELAIFSHFNKERPYWIYVMFLTPGVVLLSGLPAQVTQFADWRLLATVVGAVVCLLLLALEHAIFFRGKR